ncbi:MAG: hypothetical protein ABJG41_12860 [Cyclobacteriaceae bacterium]
MKKRTNHNFRSSFMSIHLMLGMIVFSCSSVPESPGIVVQDLKMQIPKGMPTFTEELLPGEIADTKIEHIAFAGPTEQTITLTEGNVNMFLFVKGEGKLVTDSTYRLVPESIAIPMNGIGSVQIEVADGKELHFLKFTKKLTEQDLQDIKGFPVENKYDLFFTRFEDCEPYTEKIKSPNTISRTVLPADIVPRVSLGTVEAPGPDAVGAHEHPMLDQLFLGLTNNDVVVHADSASTEFGEYALLHIPLGSSHWVTVEEEKKMYYMWMDFFLTKDGQEWLKTHKPITKDKEDY